MTIAATASLGTVTLTVADLDAQAAFYRDAIGLHELSRSGDVVELGTEGGDQALVRLLGRPEAPARPPRTTGLFHLALLVPSRAELARTVHRVAAAHHRFTGAADHLVSEALYVDDPEGNGIEIYRDRPREEWTFADGQLELPTLPLDLESILASAGHGDTAAGLPADTRIGHVHLQVASIPDADAFYIGALGFEPMVRGYRGALFVAAGGYHHHVGLNTWAGEGIPAAPDGSQGLDSFMILLPSASELARTVASARAAGVEVDTDGDGRTTVRDPAGNRAVLAVA